MELNDILEKLLRVAVGVKSWEPVQVTGRYKALSEESDPCCALERELVLERLLSMLVMDVDGEGEADVNDLE